MLPVTCMSRKPASVILLLMHSECVKRPDMPRPKLPENGLALTEDPTIPAVSDLCIARLSGLADSSPEDFAKAMAKVMRGLAIEGFRTIQAPRNYKELATVVDLWRKLEGIDKPDKGGGLPIGLVGVMRSVSRRPVVDVVAEDEGEIGFE